MSERVESDREYVLRRLQELPEPISFRDLYEHCKGRQVFRRASGLRRVVERLAVRGEVRVVPRPSPSPGRPPSPWVVSQHKRRPISLNRRETHPPRRRTPDSENANPAHPTDDSKPAAEPSTP